MKSGFVYGCKRIVVAALCLFLVFHSSVSAQEEPALVGVDAVKTEPLIQTIPVIGRLVPRQAGTVAARINGPVQHVLVEAGDRVQKNDVIAQLDVETLTAERDVADAAVESANATMTTRKAELQLAQQEVKRLERLKDSAATTKAAYDDARQNASIARARISEAQAAITAARSQLKLTEIRLSNAQVRAPYTGVITQRLAESGSYVQSGQAIVRMLTDQELELEADVPFDRLSGLIEGARVNVGLDDQTQHSAVLRAIIPEENPLTRTRAVRFKVELGNTEKPLAAEQSATVFIPVGVPRNVVSVHKDAVIRGGEGNIVYLVKDDTAKMRPVQLGEALGSRIEVMGGLNPGDVVVVRGNERLRPDQPVQVAPSS
ncbi:MAG: efflux RND transporter periplasmic adaptor subunit [Gammaproteobacteria bacterium]|nr:efflux RND transporter periplasmic adaptor subunit [Gammaproteobacteria bacterium]